MPTNDFIQSSQSFNHAIIVMERAVVDADIVNIERYGIKNAMRKKKNGDTIRTNVVVTVDSLPQ